MIKLFEEAIQPNGSPECGNHVAARQYATQHSYWHDFTPPPPSTYPSFANYTDYVAHVFKTRPFYSGGTDTAGAIQRVRTEDLAKTRVGNTYIGMLMYKSILMNLEVFQNFISSPPNLTPKIPKIAMKNFFGALLWSKIVNS